jgi:hypothetical protein
MNPGFLIPLLLVFGHAEPRLLQEPAPLVATSAPKVTLGEVALFVLDVGSASVQRNLTFALRDPNPDVRAVAARVAAVSGSKGQIPALLRALPSESDGLAGGEIVRALQWRLLKPMRFGWVG